MSLSENEQRHFWSLVVAHCVPLRVLSRAVSSPRHFSSQIGDSHSLSALLARAIGVWHRIRFTPRR